MRTLLRLALLALIITFCSSTDARSQLLTPFHVQQGYQVALDKARDTLAADAYLVYAGTFGDLDLAQFGFPLPLTLNFYQDTIKQSGFTPARYPGQADAWGYVFNSPSKGQTMSLVVLNSLLLGGWSVQGVPVELPLPEILVDTLDLNIAGTRSDTAVFRLRRNPTYDDYHAQYPEKQPNFVTLGAGLPAGIPTPPDFDMSGPIWSFTFSRSGDTSGLICLVSAGSGESTCRLVAASAVPTDASDASAIALRALPNPATDRARIIIDNASALRGEVALELLDARGVRVLDLSGSLLANDLRSADVDASALAPGVYFCRLLVDGVSHVTPLSIGSR
jgi:hypothetical protein